MDIWKGTGGESTGAIARQIATLNTERRSQEGAENRTSMGRWLGPGVALQFFLSEYMENTLNMVLINRNTSSDSFILFKRERGNFSVEIERPRFTSKRLPSPSLVGRHPACTDPAAVQPNDTRRASGLKIALLTSPVRPWKVASEPGNVAIPPLSFSRIALTGVVQPFRKHPVLAHWALFRKQVKNVCEVRVPDTAGALWHAPLPIPFAKYCRTKRKISTLILL